MGLDARECTPQVLTKVIIAVAHTRSFKQAAIVMKELAGIDISPKTIQRLTAQVGVELAHCRDHAPEAFIKPVAEPPSLAIVEFDGGRIRTRQPGHGPGVHQPNKGWRETKNACFVRAVSQTFATDPQPLPPDCFRDRAHVSNISEIALNIENSDENDAFSAKVPSRTDENPSLENERWTPNRLVRTVISSMACSADFGPMMAREAERRKFGEAKRKAYLGDGLPCNWTIWREHFRDYVPILDFVHAVSYLHAAANLCHGKTDQTWQQYEHWMIACWQGRIGKVIEAMKHWLAQQDPVTEATPEDDPRMKLQDIIQYLENNRSRMRYDEYRKQGLPVTTAWMESLVKEMNYRVKGTEMFWNDPAGAEAILQIRAASLSDDDRLLRYLTHRPGSPFVRRNPPELTLAP